MLANRAVRARTRPEIKAPWFRHDSSPRIEDLSESLAVGEAAEFYLVAIEGRHTGDGFSLGRLR
jgi:hypothetical protein